MKTKLFLFILCVLGVLSGESAFSQPIKTIGITEAVTIDGYSVRVMHSGITNIKLKKMNPASPGSYLDSLAGSEIGSTGFYKFDFTSVSNYQGNYELFIDYTKKQEYGTIQIGQFLDINGTPSMEGQLDMNNFRIFNLGAPASGIDAVNLSYLQSNYYSKSQADTGFVTRSTSQTVTGSKTFSSQLEFVITPPLMHDGDNGHLTPTADNHITPKWYVDDLVAGIVFTPYQESVNMVRLMPGGTAQTGQVYVTYSTASNYFSSPSSTRQFTVFIPGTGSSSQYVSVNHNDLKNYVHTVGIGKSVAIILGGAGGGASVTKTTTFEGIRIFMGANDISGDRTYNSVTFKNCEIYAYKNTSFNNCLLINCIVYHASGYAATLDGSTVSDGTAFNRAYTVAGSFSGKIINTTGEFNTSFTMPTDPTISE